jgi:hypothetical protein
MDRESGAENAGKWGKCVKMVITWIKSTCSFANLIFEKHSHNTTKSNEGKCKKMCENGNNMD